MSMTYTLNKKKFLYKGKEIGKMKRAELEANLISAASQLHMRETELPSPALKFQVERHEERLDNQMDTLVGLRRDLNSLEHKLDSQFNGGVLAFCIVMAAAIVGILV